MPEKYKNGFIWDPANGVIPEFYQPSEEELAAQLEERRKQLVLDTYDLQNNKARQRQEARREMMNTPVMVPATFGTASVPYSATQARVPSTVGKELALAGAALAAPAVLGSPAVHSFLGNMAIGLPAFEVADQLPTLWGDNRFTVQGGNLLESGFRALYPSDTDAQRHEENKMAPAVNQAGQFITGLPVGALGESLARGISSNIVRGFAKQDAKKALGAMSYFKPMSDALNESYEQTIELPDRWYQKNIVNEDGSINKDEMIRAYRDVLRFYNEHTLPGKFEKAGTTEEDVINAAYASGVNPNGILPWIRQILRDSNEAAYTYKSPLTSLRRMMKDTSLRDHLAGVVKTAQEIPVPAGSSRAELVRAALAHDIGKVYTGQEPSIHPIAARDMLENIGRKEFESPTLLSAIQYHMDDSHLPIYGSHGLGKVGIGNKDYLMNWDLLHALQASDVARGLSYDEAARRFPQLFTYNKETPFNVKLFAGTEQEQLDRVINPTLQRQGYPRVRNAEELNKTLLRHRSFYRGVRDPYKGHGAYPAEDIRNAKNAERLAIERYGVSTPETRLDVSAGNIPLSPTGSGRATVFNPIKYDNGLPVHSPGALSKRLKVSPEQQDVLYVSVAPQTMETYRNAKVDRPAMGARVTLPLEERGSNESLVDFLERGEFQMYNGDQIIGNTSGRFDSPMSDWQLYEEPYRLQTGRSLLEDMKRDFNGRIGEKISHAHWISDGDFYSHHSKVQALAEKVGREKGVDLSNIIKTRSNNGVDEVLSSGRESWLYDTLKLIEHGSVSNEQARKLYVDGVISGKTLETHRRLTDRFFKSGKVADKDKLIAFDKKYILGEGTLKKIKRMYQNSLRPSYTITEDFAKYMSPESKIKYMREHGVAPLYEMPSFGKTEMFSANQQGWGLSPASRNKAPSTNASQAVIIGKLGERKFDVRPYTDDEMNILLKGWVKPRGYRSGSRDAGERYWGEQEPFAVSRKTFDFGGLISRLKDHYGDGALDAIREFKKGGRIYIKPSHRGKFTALKKRTGHSASWFKAHGTPAQRKMATFALNARKWKHADGGVLDRLSAHYNGDTAKILELIQKARSA